MVCKTNNYTLILLLNKLNNQIFVIKIVVQKLRFGRENGEAHVFSSQAHQNPIFPIWRDLKRENRGREGFLRKHKTTSSTHCALTLLMNNDASKIKSFFFLVNVFFKLNKQWV